MVGFIQTWRTIMHKDEAKGSAKKVSGTVKDKLGQATGDDKMRAEGKADKAEGRIQKGFGKAKDAVATLSSADKMGRVCGAALSTTSLVSK
jgi:uncharacterized protein YjbJ (UPF0337 family)